MSIMSKKVDSFFDTMDKAETGLRLLKASQSWVQLGYFLSGAAGFKNCEKWLGGVTACQNLLRLSKAASFYRKMKARGQGEKAGDRIHHTLTYLSPITLGVVSSAAMVRFLGQEKILPLTPTTMNNLKVFCKYGGGLWGNGIASFGSFYAAYGLAHAAQKDKDKLVDEQTMGGSKYALDLAATLMEMQGVNSNILLSVKALSSHLAVAQSFRSVGEIPLWPSVVGLMGLTPRSQI